MTRVNCSPSKSPAFAIPWAITTDFGSIVLGCRFALFVGRECCCEQGSKVAKVRPR